MSFINRILSGNIKKKEAIVFIALFCYFAFGNIINTSFKHTSKKLDTYKYNIIVLSASLTIGNRLRKDDVPFLSSNGTADKIIPLNIKVYIYCITYCIYIYIYI